MAPAFPWLPRAPRVSSLVSVIVPPCSPLMEYPKLFAFDTFHPNCREVRDADAAVGRGQPAQSNLSCAASNATRLVVAQRTRRTGNATPALSSRERTVPSRQSSMVSEAFAKNAGHHRVYEYASSQSGSLRD